MKIISSSLYGKDPMYSVGAVENVKLAKEIYRDWKYIMYVEDREELRDVMQEMTELGAKVVPCPTPDGNFGMYWRFLPISLPADHIIIRDVDSRITRREALSVLEWTVSGMDCHVIRDHPHHSKFNLMGANWGIRGGIITDVHKRILKWGHWEKKGSDIFFLEKNVWPDVAGSCMYHGIDGRSMDDRQYGEPFFGQIVDEDGVMLDFGAESDERMMKRSKLYGKAEWPSKGDSLWRLWQTQEPS
jgi:hypothetical protein